MANWDNLSTQVEQNEQRAKYDSGLAWGYANPVNPLPAVAYKALKDMTAFERGYALGYLLKLDDVLHERDAVAVTNAERVLELEERVLQLEGELAAALGFAEFEAYWQAMPDLEGGIDWFADTPVSGLPDNAQTD